MLPFWSLIFLVLACKRYSLFSSVFNSLFSGSISPFRFFSKTPGPDDDLDKFALALPSGIWV